MNTNFKKALIFSLLTMASAQSFAHGSWIAERAGTATVVYGHGGNDDDYKVEKVKLVEGFDKDNNVVAIEKKEAEKNVTLAIPRSVGYVSLVLDNGFWTKDKDGKWHNVPKNEVENAEEAGHYVKNGISVVKKDAVVKPVKGLTLQIIPLENPLTKKAGDKLNIQVLYKDKPLADAKIVCDYVNMSHKSKITTDKDGKATVTIRNQGLNVIAVDHSEDLKDDPKADKNGFNSTLSFKLDNLGHD